MAFVVGDVAVEFVAKLDTFFKALDKVGERLDKLAGEDSTINVSVDNEVFDKLDRITKAVENISDLGSQVKEVFLTVFDTLDGKVGNLSEQVEDELGRTITKTEKLATDGLSRFTDQARQVLSNISPLALAQILGIGLAIEKIVKSGFDLKALLPSVAGTLGGITGTAHNLVMAIKTLDLGLLLTVVGTVGSKMLTLTGIIGLLLGGVRGISAVFLNFLQKRPEGRLQQFTQLIATINRGFNDLLLKSQRLIDQMLLISTGMITIVTLSTTLFSVATTGLATVGGLVAPIFSLAVFGITIFRRLGTIVETALLRFRAAAGDGRAQTMLFLQALRQLFPILEALAKNARPIAKAIKNFTKGGFDKRIKMVISLVQTGVQELKRIGNVVQQISSLLQREIKQIDNAITPVMDKGKILREQIGRKGSRDALAALTTVRQAVVSTSKTTLGAMDEARNKIFSLGSAFKVVKGLTTGFFSTLRGFTKGFLGADSPFGVLFDAKVILERFKTAFSAISKGMLAAFGGLGAKVRDKLVDTFRNAEKPVLKEIGDIAIAGSNLFINAFATIINPIRAILKNGLSIKGMEAAAFAFGAALGKTISSGVSVAFKVGGALFKIIGGFFKKLASGTGGITGILSSAIGKSLGGIGRLLGAGGNKARGRTGVAAVDDQERKERQKALLQRLQVDDLRNKQEKSVVVLLERLVRTFADQNKVAQAFQKTFARSDIKLRAFTDDLVGVPIEKLATEMKDQIAVVEKFVQGAEKLIPNTKGLEEQIRAAAKATGKTVLQENKMVQAVQNAEAKFRAMISPLQSSADELRKLKDKLALTGGEFTDLSVDDMNSEVSKLSKEIGEWRKHIREHEKALTDLSGKTTKTAQRQRDSLQKSLDVERAAEKELTAKRKATQANLRAAIISEKIAEVGSKTQEQLSAAKKFILEQDKLSKGTGALNSVFEQVSRQFGAAGLKGAAETLEKTNKIVVTREQQLIQNIEDQIRDGKALREQQVLLRKRLNDESTTLASRTAIDAELAVIERKLAEHTQQGVKSEADGRAARIDLTEKTRKAATSFDGLVTVNESAKTSMASLGKSVRRAAESMSGVERLVQEVFAKEGGLESRLGGKKSASSKSVQNLKSNPALKMIKGMETGAIKSEAAILELFASFNKAPLGQIKDMNTALTTLFNVINTALRNNDIKKLDAILETFGADAIEFATRLKESGDGVKKFVNTLRAGKGGAGFNAKQKNELTRVLTQSLKDGEKEIGPIIERIKAKMRSSVNFTSDKLQSDKKLAQHLTKILDAAKGVVDKKAGSVWEQFRLFTEHKSPPKAGPLRAAELSLKLMGGTMVEQIMKGQGTLRAGITRFLKPFSDNMKLQSPPLAGPLRAALLSMPRLGQTMINLIMRGLGPLRQGFTSFLRKGFQGPLDNFITNMSTQLKDLGLTANRLRLSPDQFKKFGEAIDLLGGSSQDAETSLTQLIQNIDRAVTDGNAGEMAVQFSKAGIALDDLAKMSPDKVFIKLIKAINEADGDLETQSELLRLVGAEFTNMRGIILEGTDKIQGAFEEVAKRPPLTDETVETAKRFTTIMSRIQQTIQRIAIIIFEEVGPAIEGVISGVSGGVLPSVNEVLETVRAGARIVIRSIGAIAKFVRDRWVNARDGLDNFVQDLTAIGQVAVKLIERVLGVLFNKAGPLIETAVSAIWTRIGGKSKSAAGALLAEILGLLQKAALAFVAFSGAAVEEIWFRAKQVVLLARKAILLQLEKLSAETLDIVNQVLNVILGAFNILIWQFNFVIDIINELGGDMDRLPDLEANFSAKTISAELGKVDKELKSLSDEGSQFSETFSKIFKELEQFAGVDKNTEKLKEVFDVSIAGSEVATAIKEIAETSDDAGERLERLRGILKQVSADDSLLSLSDTTAEKIEERLRGLAEMGKIIPGTITEGRDRLLKETKEAFESAGSEIALAFQDVFHEAGTTLEDLAPGIVNLGNLGNQISQEELADINIRLSKLRTEGVTGVKAIEQAFTEADAAAKKLSEDVKALADDRKVFDLKSIGFNLTRQFRDMLGELGPFEKAQRDVVDNFRSMESALFDIRQQFIELGEDREMLTKLAEGFNLLVDENLTNEQIRDKIKKAIESGFQEGANAIAAGPVRDLVRDNFVAPILDGFKQTIKGLVDGTLIEAAREAEAIAQQTGQKFSRVLFIVADFGQRIFEAAFDKLLDQTMELLTDTLSNAIADSFTSDAAKDGAKGLGDVAGSAIGAALTAAIAVAGLLLSRLQSEVKAQKEQIESIIETTEAVRGVISGSTTVAIKEVQDTLINSQRPITNRLDELIRIGHTLAGNGTVPISPLGGASGTTI